MSFQRQIPMGRFESAENGLHVIQLKILMNRRSNKSILRNMRFCCKWRFFHPMTHSFPGRNKKKTEQETPLWLAADMNHPTHTH